MLSGHTATKTRVQGSKYKGPQLTTPCRSSRAALTPRAGGPPHTAPASNPTPLSQHPRHRPTLSPSSQNIQLLLARTHASPPAPRPSPHPPRRPAHAHSRHLQHQQHGRQSHRGAALATDIHETQGRAGGEGAEVTGPRLEGAGEEGSGGGSGRVVEDVVVGEGEDGEGEEEGGEEGGEEEGEAGVGFALGVGEGC